MGADPELGMSIWLRCMPHRCFNPLGWSRRRDGGYIQRAPLPHPLPESLEERLKKHGFDQNQRSDTWHVLECFEAQIQGASKQVIL